KRRIADYDPKVLDQLCLTGAVGSGRLSPHPATLEAVTVGKRRAIPTSVAPITFFVREDADWMIPRREDSEASSVGLSPDAAAVHLYLRQRALEAICWMLLRRCGIVFRELLTRETILPKWRELLITLRRLEDRGELRGGRFVSNFLGEQFALPVAVESLRAMRNQQPCGEIIAISAADPLNLVGIIVPGERVAANSGSVVSYRDGVALERNESANVISMPIAR